MVRTCKVGGVTGAVTGRAPTVTVTNRLPDAVGSTNKERALVSER